MSNYRRDNDDYDDYRTGGSRRSDYRRDDYRDDDYRQDDYRSSVGRDNYRSGGSRYDDDRRGGGGGGGDDQDYDDGPRRYKNTRTIPRGRGDDADYMEETTYIERGKGPPPKDLVYRRRDDSAEDIDRDFPPPGYRGGRSRGDDDYDDRSTTSRRRARSAGGSRRGGYDDDDDDGYRYRGGRRDSRRDGYYSDESRSRSGERKKSGIEGTLEGLGLGGIAGALLGKDKDKDKRGGSRSRSRSRAGGHGSDKKERQWAQAAQAAIVAGAIEAFRSRNEPGPWTGDKGRRIATAALGAGGIDRLIDRDPEHKSKRHLAEAVVGGLAANRLANGPRSQSRGANDGRGRSRSRSRSIMDRFRSKSRRRSDSGDSRDRSRSRGRDDNGVPLKGILAGGTVAAAGKAIYDKVRSKSRGRDRSPDSGSEDSYVPSRNRRRDVGSSRSMPPDGRGPDDQAVMAPQDRGRGSVATRDNGEPDRKLRDESEDSQSSTDMENQRKKLRGKEYLTAALASVATIHAAHGIYNTMKGSEKRHQLVESGEMSREEARKKKSKAWLQDAAAIGIAALGIKGAYSEWKEMNEQRHSVQEIEERRRKRQKRRQRRMQEARMNGSNGGGGGGLPPPNGGGLPPPPGGGGYYGR